MYKCGVQKGKVLCMNVESKRVKISEQNKIDGIVQVPWESIGLILVRLSPFSLDLDTLQTCYKSVI